MRHKKSKVIMSIKIISHGALFIISNRQSIIHLAKSHIRRVSIFRDDTLAIETGERPNRNIYLPFSDIIEPVFETIPLLQNWMGNEIKLSITGGGSPGTATEATQLQLLALLQQMVTLGNQIKALITTYTGGDEMGPPDFLDETQLNVIYKGWSQSIHGQGSSPVWAIQKTVTDKVPNEILWADGNKLYDNTWTERYTLDYLPLI